MSSSSPSSSSPPSVPYPHGMSLHVSIYIRATDIGKFFAAFRPVYESVINEPECLFFEVYKSTPAPPSTSTPEKEEEEVIKLSWVEDWAYTPESFMTRQMSKEYYADYLAATELLFVRPREFEVRERLGSPYFSVGRA
ncbi:hypothetical protein F5Y17DRAFT_37070 [Xylariaceae sp. FL0594]|nr:hypothetical protein F5Y17DRAFT_37070 [Xylariaceae sp. FL0594]